MCMLRCTTVPCKTDHHSDCVNSHTHGDHKVYLSKLHPCMPDSIFSKNSMMEWCMWVYAPSAFSYLITGVY
jgi:hypothetical protein